MTTQTSEITTRNMNEVVGTLAQAEQLFQGQDLLAKMADLLPKHLKPERIFRLAAHACQKNPELLKCTKASWMVALIEASETGLEPDGHEAAIIPYGNIATFQPMYYGVCKAAIESGMVKDTHADVVYEHDEFEFYHGTPTDFLFHRPAFGDRGQPIGAWARAILPDGTPKITFYDFAKIERIRLGGKQPNGLMWAKHWDEGAKKTAIKGLHKTIPHTARFAKTITIDNRLETDVEAAPLSSQRVQMPRRLSQATAPIAAPAPEPPKEPDYSQDIPPLCRACGGASILKPPGRSGNQTWGWKWRCLTCPKGTKGCVTDAAAYHELEVVRLAKVAAAAASQQPAAMNEPVIPQAQREPGEDQVTITDEDIPF